MTDQEVRDENGQPIRRKAASVVSSAPGLKLADDAKAIAEGMRKLNLRGDDGIGGAVAKIPELYSLGVTKVRSVVWQSKDQREQFHQFFSTIQAKGILSGELIITYLPLIFAFAYTAEGSTFWVDRMCRVTPKDKLPEDLREIIITYLEDHMNWVMGN